jgi:hypothetical protein
MTPAELNKQELKRALELLSAVTTARDLAEGKLDAAVAEIRLSLAQGEVYRIERDIARHEVNRLRDCNLSLASDLNAALARCAELEHHLSPAPNGATREPSEGERGKSQVRQNAAAGEETLGMTYEIRIPNQPAN